MRVLIGVSVGAAILAGSGVHAVSREPSTLERIRSAGIVRVAYSNEPPHAFRTPDGRVTGEGPEVTRHLLHTIGVDSIEWVWSPFRSLFLELRSGRVDLVAAGAYITPERSRSVRFTRPTLAVPTALLVRAGDTTWLRSLSDLASNTSAHIAILAGSAERGIVRQAGIDTSRFLVVPDAHAGYAAVLSGNVQAFAASIVSLRLLRTHEADSASLAVIRAHPPGAPDEASSIGQSAIAARLEDDDLVRELDRHLADWLGSPDHLRLLAQLGLGSDLVPFATRR